MLLHHWLTILLAIQFDWANTAVKAVVHKIACHSDWSAGHEQGLHKRMESAAVLHQPLRPAQRKGSGALPVASIQMRRIRAAFSEQAGVLASAQDALTRLELQMS